MSAFAVAFPEVCQAIGVFMSVIRSLKLLKAMSQHHHQRSQQQQQHQQEQGQQQSDSLESSDSDCNKCNTINFDIDIAEELQTNKEAVDTLICWAVFAAMQVYVLVLERFFKWIPGYYSFKGILVVLICFPMTRISNLLFKDILLPSGAYLYKRLGIANYSSFSEFFATLPFVILLIIFPPLGHSHDQSAATRIAVSYSEKELELIQSTEVIGEEEGGLEIDLDREIVDELEAVAEVEELLSRHINPMQFSHHTPHAHAHTPSAFSLVSPISTITTAMTTEHNDKQQSHQQTLVSSNTDVNNTSPSNDIDTREPAYMTPVAALIVGNGLEDSVTEAQIHDNASTKDNVATVIDDQSITSVPITPLRNRRVTVGTTSIIARSIGSNTNNSNSNTTATMTTPITRSALADRTILSSINTNITSNNQPRPSVQSKTPTSTDDKIAETSRRLSSFRDKLQESRALMEATITNSSLRRSTSGGNSSSSETAASNSSSSRSSRSSAITNSNNTISSRASSNISNTSSGNNSSNIINSSSGSSRNAVLPDDRNVTLRDRRLPSRTVGGTTVSSENKRISKAVSPAPANTPVASSPTTNNSATSTSGNNRYSLRSSTGTAPRTKP